MALTGTPAGGTFSGAGVTGSIFNPATAGNGSHTLTYSYTLNGCGNSTTSTTTVNAAPVVSATASPASIAAGGNSQLSAQPSASNYSYAWTPAASLSDPTVSNPTASPVTTTTYTVTVTNTVSGCSSTGSTVVAVLLSAGEDASSESLFNTLPNPFSDKFEAVINARTNTRAVLTLTDVLGRTVETKTVTLAKGENRISFQVSSTSASGLYLLQAQIGSQVVHAKLIKE